VFLGRFVALLRILAAFLAGVNRMPWRAFLIANASGGIIWAAARYPAPSWQRSVRRDHRA
jgi:membrane protein DedA with SNARE-associated domain